MNFIAELAWAKARDAPTALQPAAACAWKARWSAVLAVAEQGAYAASVLGWDPGTAAGRDNTEPLLLSCVMGEAVIPPEESRLPLREEA